MRGNADALGGSLTGYGARLPTFDGAASRALSTRQAEVLALLVDGFTDREVGARLGISVKTAETHRARIRERLDCRTRADLVRVARARGEA